MKTPAASATPLTHKPLRGLALIVGATALFAYSDAVSKILVTEYNVPLVAAIRYLTHLLLMVAIVAPLQGRQMVQTQRTGMVVVRALCLTCGTLMMGLALQRMPLAETTAILYIAPVLVIILSGPLLKEKVGPGAWVAVVLGFVGVMLIVRPGAGLDPWGVVFSLANVAMAVAYNMMSRSLAHTERTMALLFYAALVGSIIFGITLPWTLHGDVPTALEIAMFLSLGVAALLGHYLFTQSYRYAPAALLAPMNYLHLLWAVLVGWVVFQHNPGPIALIGMVLVALAGIASAAMARRRPPTIDGTA
jgi:drug/metabolite transporter (DMT)-like permease